MWIEIGNVYARVLRASAEENAWLLDYLSVPNPKAHFSGAPPRTDIYNLHDRLFPAGYLALVERAAGPKGFIVEVKDRRVAPCTPDPNADVAWLYDYQRAAVERVVSRKRGILWIPTAGGKTEIAVGITRRLPCRWLYISPRKGLMDQAANRYDQRNEEHGIYLVAGRCGDGKWDPRHAFTSVTYDAIRAGLDSPAREFAVRSLLGSAQGVIIDECHTLPADTYVAIVNMLTSAYYRVGMSGTPLARGDRRSVIAIGATGPVIYKLPAETLVAKGVLSKAHVSLVPLVQHSVLPTWPGVYGELVARSKARNTLLVDLAKIAQKPAILFCIQTKHGRILAKMLAKAGLQTRFVWGNHPLESRQRAIRDLVAGRLDVLVASDGIFSTGIDVPELRSVIVGSGHKSIIETLQRIGRGMRVHAASGKFDFDVWDISDSGQQWLQRHARARKRAYLAEGHEVIEVTRPPTMPLFPGTSAP